ncbi:hypothetical protein MTO96_037010 [Rhipicephalus appendiculatus]
MGTRERVEMQDVAICSDVNMRLNLTLQLCAHPALILSSLLKNSLLPCVSFLRLSEHSRRLLPGGSETPVAYGDINVPDIVPKMIDPFTVGRLSVLLFATVAPKLCQIDTVNKFPLGALEDHPTQQTPA